MRRTSWNINIDMLPYTGNGGIPKLSLCFTEAVYTRTELSCKSGTLPTKKFPLNWGILAVMDSLSVQCELIVTD